MVRRRFAGRFYCVRIQQHLRRPLWNRSTRAQGVSRRKQYGVWNGSTRSRQSQSSQELGHQIRQILQAFRSH
ncbi:MAG: hypothetical protein RLZZ444_1021 [Pseudomonadota bacterium]